VQYLASVRIVHPFARLLGVLLSLLCCQPPTRQVGDKHLSVAQLADACASSFPLRLVSTTTPSILFIYSIHLFYSSQLLSKQIIQDMLETNTCRLHNLQTLAPPTSPSNSSQQDHHLFNSIHNVSSYTGSFVRNNIYSIHHKFYKSKQIYIQVNYSIKRLVYSIHHKFYQNKHVFTYLHPGPQSL